MVTYADNTCLLFPDILWKNVYFKAMKGLNLTYKCLNKIWLFINYDKTNNMKF